MLVFVAWCLAVAWRLWSRSAWLFAAFLSVAVLALQTDVLGVHWLAYVVFALAGSAVVDPTRTRGVESRINRPKM